MLLTAIPLRVIIIAACGGGAAVVANALSFVMIGKINERVAENERISYFWWGTEVRKKFKQLYPRNWLVVLLDSSVFIMIVCFVLLLKFWVFGNPSAVK